MRLINLLFVLVLSAAAGPAWAADSWTLASPDGTLHFDLRLEPDGSLRYAVFRSQGAERRVVLEWSPLGVSRGDQAFVTGLKFTTATSPAAVDESYVAPHGKRRAIRHRANELAVSFVNGRGAPLVVVARVADDGAAFRYRFPDQYAAPRDGDRREHRLRGTRRIDGLDSSADARREVHARLRGPLRRGSGRHRRADARGLGLPGALPGRRRPRVAAHHRGGRRRAPTRPRRLDPQPSGGVYRVRLPEPGEGLGVGAVEPSSRLPWTLPWRVLIVGRTLADRLRVHARRRPLAGLRRGRHQLDPSGPRVVELVVRR